MKTDIEADLAEQLAGNPFLFGSTKEDMLAELLNAYIDGQLPPADAAEVERLLLKSARAKTMYQNALAASRFLDSPEGKAWLHAAIPGQNAQSEIGPVAAIVFALRAFFRDYTLPVAATAGGRVKTKEKSAEHRFTLDVRSDGDTKRPVSLLVHLVKRPSTINCHFELVETPAGGAHFPVVIEWRRQLYERTVFTEAIVFERSGLRVTRNARDVHREEHWTFTSPGARQ